MKILALVLLLAAAARAFGAESKAPPGGDWRVFGEYDYYFPSNSGQGLKDQLKTQSDTLLAGNYDSTTQSVAATGGSGATIGAMLPWDRKTKIGASFSYVLGPTMNANFTAQSQAVGNGGYTINRAVSYFRLMGRMSVTLLSSGRERPTWTGDVDVAGGAALGHVDQSCTASGSLTCPFGGSVRNWGGFTYEFSPKIVYHGAWFDLDAGGRYAGFPTFKGTDQIARIGWESFGIFVGAEF